MEDTATISVARSEPVKQSVAQAHEPVEMHILLCGCQILNRHCLQSPVRACVCLCAGDPLGAWHTGCGSAPAPRRACMCDHVGPEASNPSFSLSLLRFIARKLPSIYHPCFAHTTTATHARAASPQVLNLTLLWYHTPLQPTNRPSNIELESTDRGQRSSLLSVR